MTNPTLCKTRKDIDALWPYKNYKAAIKQYPKFPCFAEFSRYDGGLCGDGFTIVFVPAPKDVDLESFRKGLIAADKATCMGGY